MTSVGVGITLQPDPEFLDLLGEVLLDEADYFEIAPETTWRERPDGTLIENSYARWFHELGEQAGIPFVAHGVGFSVGSSHPEEHRRQQRWIERLQKDQSTFQFRWLTDHLGMNSVSLLQLMLPLALPWTSHGAELVQRALQRLQGVVPDVGVENSVPYFFPGNPLEEPTFLHHALAAPRTHLLLDLHNVFTVAKNAGFDPEDYLAGVDGSRVIEIHISGGSESHPSWLPGGKTVRLDSHDNATPEEVFRLLERFLPRCPNLRGITLERMEGTVQQQDVAEIREELRTLRSMISRSKHHPFSESPQLASLPKAPPQAHVDYEQAIARALRASTPAAALQKERERLPRGSEAAIWLDAIDEDGFRLAALLVARLRFERLTRGSPEADAWFEEAPADFTEAFRAYHEQREPEAFFPGHEARLFSAWRAS